MLDSRRNRAALHREAARLLGEQPRDDRLHVGSGERRLTRDHLVGDHAERVHVGASVDRALAHRLLGRHVLRCPQRHSRLRHAGAASRLHGDGDTEIRDQRVPVTQQDVLRLDVAMDHAQPVGVAEGIGHLASDGDGVVDRELSFALEPVPQRLARHERHHVVQQAVGLAAVEERQDVRMLESRGRPNLGQKALAAERRAELRV